MEKTGKRGWRLMRCGITGLLAVFTLITLSGSTRYRDSNYDAISVMWEAKTQPLDPGGVTYLPVSMRPSLVSPEIMRQKSDDPVSTRVPKIYNVFIPVVEKEENPLSFQSRLPLLIKSGNLSLPSPPPDIAFKEKTILVDISDQHVYAYDKGKLIFSFVASTGRHNLTRTGKYKILDKIPKAYSDPWRFWMPNWMGIYYAGYNLENGFHSLPVLPNGAKLWGNKIGTPVTYGCVVLMPNDMQKLYRWAGIGTAVIIQK